MPIAGWGSTGNSMARRRCGEPSIGKPAGRTTSLCLLCCSRPGDEIAVRSALEKPHWGFSSRLCSRDCASPNPVCHPALQCTREPRQREQDREIDEADHRVGLQRPIGGRCHELALIEQIRHRDDR